MAVTAAQAIPSSGGVGLWKHALILAILIGFSGLLFGGFAVYRSQAPIPTKIVDQSGTLLTTGEAVSGGKAVYQKYNLMDYGSVLGHGAYLGPDFTADSLHLMTVAMRGYHARAQFGADFSRLSADQQAAIAERVKTELKANRYDAATGTLTLSASQAYGLEQVRAHYQRLFIQGDVERALPPDLIQEQHMPATDRAYVAQGDQIQQMADFFVWTAWLSAVNRPGLDYSYTNNWPFDAAAGNDVTLAAVLWSGVSVTLLVLFTALILFLYHRFRMSMEGNLEAAKTLKLSTSTLTPSQRKTAKYFAVVTLLLLVQTLLGALMAHYYVQGDSFYGLDIMSLLPFNIARGWHLQLAVFWVATAWLALGIFVAPIVGGREPKRQGLLVDILFVALVLVVAGSMLGEWLGAKGYLGNLWFLLGNQGWEYLELGRVWQLLLTVGLALWLFILYRGLRPALKAESDRGGLTHLLLYSAVAIPFFYGFAFFFDPSSHITMSDYWRWWVIHLWVEGMFEVFAVVVIGFLMVKLGLVTSRSTLRALYFQLLILLGSGIIGTGHHYYWIGAPEIWIALGAVFSALEVIPLTLLVLEAYGQYRLVTAGGRQFPYRASFWFLIATAFWNLTGAGVLGFLINLPVVNYFEHGSFLTAAHGHGALAGVYGMLAVGLLLFAMRDLVNPSWWSDRLLKVSFWGMNLGLAGMILVTLLPIGLMQVGEAFTNGFWSARSFEFYRQPLVHALLWARILPDSVFIGVGVMPLAWFTVTAFFHQRSAREDLPAADGASPAEEEKGRRVPVKI
ncbi:MAG: nitric-oxide reductase large subunit [Chloroflexota bacterium]